MRQRNLSTQPPAEHTYLEWLRYLVQSSDSAAGELPFLVGVWDACIRNKGLTPKQEAALQPYIDEANAFLDAHVYLPQVEDLPQPIGVPCDMTNVVSIFDHTRGK